ncbi:MAG: DUF2179 domain-containing protein [Bacteroidota bacterium]
MPSATGRSFFVDCSTGEVKILFTIVQRESLGTGVKLIKVVSPNAFYTVEDV